MKIKGSGTYKDTNGKSHSVIGVGELADAEKLRKLEVAGSLSFEKIYCDKISVAGKCEGDFVSAQVLKISGSCEIDSVTIEQRLEVAGKAEIDSVTADEVLIASRSGFLGDVKCRKIKIYDDSAKFDDEVFKKNFIGRFTALQSWSRVRVKNIEAEVVALENCEVDIIRCKDAFIGANCVIDKLLVSGKCKVADDSTVGEMIHT